MMKHIKCTCKGGQCPPYFKKSCCIQAYFILEDYDIPGKDKKRVFSQKKPAAVEVLLLSTNTESNIYLCFEDKMTYK